MYVVQYRRQKDMESGSCGCKPVIRIIITTTRQHSYIEPLATHIHALHQRQYPHIPERSPLNMYIIIITKNLVTYIGPNLLSKHCIIPEHTKATSQSQEVNF